MSKQKVTTKGPAPKRAGAKAIIKALLQFIEEVGAEINATKEQVALCVAAQEFVDRKPAKRLAAKSPAKPVAGKTKKGGAIARHVYTAMPGQCVHFEDATGVTAFRVVVNPEGGLLVRGYSGEARESLLVMPHAANAITVTRPGDWK